MAAGAGIKQPRHQVCKTTAPPGRGAPPWVAEVEVATWAGDDEGKQSGIPLAAVKRYDSPIGDLALNQSNH